MAKVLHNRLKLSPNEIAHCNNIDSYDDSKFPMEIETNQSISFNCQQIEKFETPNVEYNYSPENINESSSSFQWKIERNPIIGKFRQRMILDMYKRAMKKANKKNLINNHKFENDENSIEADTQTQDSIQKSSWLKIAASHPAPQVPFWQTKTTDLKTLVSTKRFTNECDEESILRGTFTQQEDYILIRNLVNMVKLFDFRLEDLFSLLGSRSGGKRGGRRRGSDLVDDLGIYARLAEGLNRAGCQLRVRILSILTTLLQDGRGFTAEAEQQILDYVNLHGTNNWQALSLSLNRTNDSVRHKYEELMMRKGVTMKDLSQSEGEDDKDGNVLTVNKRILEIVQEMHPDVYLRELDSNKIDWSDVNTAFMNRYNKTRRISNPDFMYSFIAAKLLHYLIEPRSTIKNGQKTEKVQFKKRRHLYKCYMILFDAIENTKAEKIENIKYNKIAKRFKKQCKHAKQLQERPDVSRTFARLLQDPGVLKYLIERKCRKFRPILPVKYGRPEELPINEIIAQFRSDETASFMAYKTSYKKKNFNNNHGRIEAKNSDNSDDDKLV